MQDWTKAAMLRSGGIDVIPGIIMLVSCPNCLTEYSVPDAALTGRSRTLRCSSCMTKWKVPALDMYREELNRPAGAAPAEAALTEPTPTEPAPAETLAIAEPEPMEAPQPVPDPVPESMPETSKIVQIEAPPSARRGLVISALLLAAIIVGVLAAHRPIGHFWPPSLRLFHALGLH